MEVPHLGRIGASVNCLWMQDGQDAVDEGAVGEANNSGLIPIIVVRSLFFPKRSSSYAGAQLTRILTPSRFVVRSNRVSISLLPPRYRSQVASSR